METQYFIQVAIIMSLFSVTGAILLHSGADFKISGAKFSSGMFFCIISILIGIFIMRMPAYTVAGILGSVIGPWAWAELKRAALFREATKAIIENSKILKNNLTPDEMTSLYLRALKQGVQHCENIGILSEEKCWEVKKYLRKRCDHEAAEFKKTLSNNGDIFSDYLSPNRILPVKFAIVFGVAILTNIIKKQYEHNAIIKQSVIEERRLLLSFR